MEAYAKRHGYAYVEVAPYEGTHPTWWSVGEAAEVLLRGADKVIWVDADVLISDEAPDLFSLAWPGDWHLFMQHSSILPRSTSAWLWGLRNGEEAVELLTKVWTYRDKDLGIEREQAAFKEELPEMPILLSKPFVADYGVNHDNPFFVHASHQAGTWEQRRDYLMGKKVERPHIPAIGSSSMLIPVMELDSSGAVSALLIAGGLLERPLYSGDFLNWGQSGVGEVITVWANEGHCFIEMRVGDEIKHFGAGPDGIGWQSQLHSKEGFAPRCP